MNKIGFVYNALVPEAPPFIDSLIESLKLRENSWICSAADLETAPDLVEQTTLMVVAGVDGTILRTIHVIAPHSIPIVGVNMGRVGFMSELRPENAAEKLPSYLNGDMRVERRMMLYAEVFSPTDNSTTDESGRTSPSRSPVWAATGCIMSIRASGKKIGLPADRAYPVLPVAVEMMTASAR